MTQQPLFQTDDRGAEFSDCRRYRYLLWRRWGDGPQACFIGLNPSTADEAKDDPTMRREIGFAKSWGYGGLIKCNLFAQISTSPAALDPDAPAEARKRNNFAINRACRESGLTVCAWGAFGGPQGQHCTRWLLGRGFKPRALAVTKQGHPGHTLYLPGNLKPKTVIDRKSACPDCGLWHFEGACTVLLSNGEPMKEVSLEEAQRMREGRR